MNVQLPERQSNSSGMRYFVKKALLFLKIKLIGSISLLIFRFPWSRRKFWTKHYNQISEIFTDDYIFMNLGYASVKPEGEENPPEDFVQIERLSEQLYRHVIGEISLEDKDVLEVGCGRGGGSLYIKRQFQPNTLIAVDIAQKAIERCKHIHHAFGIHFQQADAMSLPFSEQQFDAVVNIESSHCYPSRKQFFSEVVRILRPGGFFFYADLISFIGDNVTTKYLQRLLEHSGLTTIRAEDISKNVLRSRDLLTQSGLFDKAMYSCLKDELKPYSSVIIPATKRGAYLKGTASYKCLQAGIITYGCWTLQKQEKYPPARL